jgi:ribosomal protein S16
MGVFLIPNESKISRPYDKAKDWSALSRQNTDTVKSIYKAKHQKKKKKKKKKKKTDLKGPI